MSSSKKAKETLLAKAARRMKRRKQKREDRVNELRELGLTDLQQKLKDEGLLEGMPLMRNPPGKAKMSDILRQFAEPYADALETLPQYENLLGMSMLAWNIALLPEERRQAETEEVLKRLIQDRRSRAFFQDFIETMIVRKIEHFDEYTRRIIKFQVRDLGDQYHISVASSLD